MSDVCPVGVVRSPRSAGEGSWGGTVSRIELYEEVFEPSATDGLDEFSHIEVIYSFHEITEVCRESLHPRGNTSWPRIGILAQRHPERPNHLGLSVCELLHVDGLKLTVRELDAFDGSPVLDIKPYRQAFAPRGEVREPRWSRELMMDYY